MVDKAAEKVGGFVHVAAVGECDIRSICGWVETSVTASDITWTS